MRRLKKEFWPICITISIYDDDIEEWLSKNMGAFKIKWNAVYYNDKTDYYFKQEKDAILFSLRWS